MSKGDDGIERVSEHTMGRRPILRRLGILLQETEVGVKKSKPQLTKLARVNNKITSTSILIEAGTKVNNEFQSLQFLHTKMNFTSIITKLSPRIKNQF